MRYASVSGQLSTFAGNCKNADIHCLDPHLGGGCVNVELKVGSLHCEPIEQMDGNGRRCSPHYFLKIITATNE